MSSPKSVHQSEIVFWVTAVGLFVVAGGTYVPMGSPCESIWVVDVKIMSSLNPCTNGKLYVFQYYSSLCGCSRCVFRSVGVVNLCEIFINAHECVNGLIYVHTYIPIV